MTIAPSAWIAWEISNDMPLVSVLMFQQQSLSVHPEEMVADLLKQVHGQSA